MLIFAIYKWVLPPLNKAMEERQEQIRTSLEAADQARPTPKPPTTSAGRVLEQARQQAREIVATANRTAEQVRTDAQARGQGEYDRIVGNAEVEVDLARQRAVEEAASRLGELVIEVVERVIGREVNAEAHRDLIDEAVAALRADTSGGAAAGAGAAPVNPTAPGLLGRGRSRRPDATTSGRSRPDLEAVEQLVLSERAAARCALPTPRCPARPAGPSCSTCSTARSRRRPAGWRRSPPWRWRPRRCRRRSRGSSTRVRQPGRGLDAEPSLSLTQSRQRVGGYATALHEDMSPPQLEAMEDELFRFARIVGSTPPLRGALTDRDLDVAGTRRAWSPTCWRARSRRRRCASPATPSPADGPATSWARWTGWSS